MTPVPSISRKNNSGLKVELIPLGLGKHSGVFVDRRPLRVAQRSLAGPGRRRQGGSRARTVGESVAAPVRVSSRDPFGARGRGGACRGWQLQAQRKARPLARRCHRLWPWCQCRSSRLTRSKMVSTPRPGATAASTLPSTRNACAPHALRKMRAGGWTQMRPPACHAPVQLRMVLRRGAPTPADPCLIADTKASGRTTR